MTDRSVKTRSRHYAAVARAIDYIRANARRQPDLAEIAAAVDLSEYHLQRIFTAWAGISPKRFLQYLTKEHARQVLERSADILGTALESGLSGPGRLHDLMVSCEAMTPGEIKRLGTGVTVGCGTAATPFGDALFGWTPRGVCYLAFCNNAETEREEELSRQWPGADLIRDDRAALRLSTRIFPLEPGPGKLSLVLRGTNFQIKVWEALLRIGPSRLVSYGQLAAMIGSPRAGRAVGSAVAANKISYLIPCHRVIRESGEWGNYRWGASRKLAMQIWEAGQRGGTGNHSA